MSSKYLIVIVGPTAIGKTNLSVEVASELACPVVSADSRQFFKEMSIGTAKPSVEEMRGIPHYFIDSHSIVEQYNVGKYEKEAIDLIEKLFTKHDTVVLVGGSGLYIEAICKGFDILPQADIESRKHIDALLHTEGIEGLQLLLKKLDPIYYNQVDIQNPQRLSRALEVCVSSGKPYSEQRKGESKKRSFNCIKIGLTTNRDTLYDNINKRVDEMMRNGLLKEVKGLESYKHLNALQTVGYKELFDFLAGNIDLSTAIQLIKQNTRRFAKRQLTWFRRDEAIKWFEPHQRVEVITYLKQTLASTNG